jgi:hypothetical protein
MKMDRGRSSAVGWCGLAYFPPVYVNDSCLEIVIQCCHSGNFIFTY